MREDTATYILRPYSTAFPWGTLVVHRIPGTDSDGRTAFACAIAWTEDADTLRPHIVFDEIVRSGVGEDAALDEIAATALGFACYHPHNDPDGPYTCEPAGPWQAWVESYGEDVESLRWLDEGADDSGMSNGMAQLRHTPVTV